LPLEIQKPERLIDQAIAISLKNFRNDKNELLP
jgi:hypothetical protein